MAREKLNNMRTREGRAREVTMKKEKTFTVMDMPVEERPRERLQEVGADSLSSAELLAIVIGRGVAGRSVMTIAQELVTTFGSVRAISEATIEELARIKGIGTAKAVQLKAAFALAKRQGLSLERPTVSVNNPTALGKAVWREIKDKKKEHFTLVLLNTRNLVVSVEPISTGTLSASLVHPREVFKEAIRHSAASVAIAHNHPSGDVTPSEEDLQLTKRLVQAGKLLGIEVLDHVIVADGDAIFSFKERGLM
jgi:DNA repair protein RadC